MVEVIDGKKFSEEILQKIKNETTTLINKHNIRPGLGVIILGEDPASQIYVKSKSQKAKECGFHSITKKLKGNTPEHTLIQHIQKFNKDPLIHGILVQLPLPYEIKKEAIIQEIAPEKDVDGFHYINIGKLTAGTTQNAFIPCTAAGIMMVIQRLYGNDLSGLDAVIIGRSNIVGKPIASLLLSANATTTITHSHTRDLPEVVRSADILIAAVGQAEMIKGTWIKPGATVIDVGINRVNTQTNKILGDVEYDMASIIAKAITPVPGGIGPITIAMLMSNTLKAAYNSAKITLPPFLNSANDVA
ncbi:MAG: methylenetetrahydrofolate dehydrogenase (NADP+) / methenyltetrahydrofolate cyclohydrolase [Candidatus Tokpelaia sp. JSC161]|nr:MAG: methylenetetrahydrofolate dehydrogenase (NADP+) / methenyltetrahydrofolate cyclohydrolase [Candidatus Tokpelaia sp. JSC161]